MKVKEVLQEIQAKSEKSPNRFSKKSFKKLLKAMANDQDFEELIAQVKGGEYVGDEIIYPAKELRKWCRKMVEKAGVDKSESAKVLDKDFVIDDVDGIYEFFASVLYEFMASGNSYSILPKKDLKGDIYIKSIEEKTKTVKCRNPKTGEDMDPFDQKVEEHRVLAVKSPAPDYLKHRI